MRRDWFIAAILSVSMLAMAQQQPKVINAQFHTESAGAGLSATVNTLQHSNGPLWLGYEVAAVPGSHFSMCSRLQIRRRTMDVAVCIDWRIRTIPFIRQTAIRRRRRALLFWCGSITERWTRFALLGPGADWMREDCRSPG